MIKSLAIASIAAIGIATPASANVNFEQMGESWGEAVCQAYNPYESTLQRELTLRGAGMKVMFEDERFVDFTLNGGDLSNYQEEQMAVGMFKSVAQKCPSKLGLIIRDLNNM